MLKEVINKRGKDFGGKSNKRISISGNFHCIPSNNESRNKEVVLAGNRTKGY